ncbi:MAG TPA: peptide MFS transporter [Rhizomicrobium sp.]|jgi:POT family proton-dependent oligopeptide transporter
MTAGALEKTWFGQPRGLTILFLTEMWTEFSFFGMRALLVYYMTKELMFSQTHSSLVYGLYGSFVYFTPLIGGAISDRWLGRKRAVILGGSIMAAGHFMMAFPALLYPALATIAVGNGLFLPSLPSQINLLYAEDDPRRASAYNIYYVGINVGAFLAPFACGTVGEWYGWHWGFTLAGIGMVFGLIVYLAGQRYLPADIRREAAVEHPQERARIPTRVYLVLASVASIVVIFRAAYEQSGNTVALWADSGVDRMVHGIGAIPMTWFQSLNPLLIFLLTPLVVLYWTRQGRRGREPGEVHKMAMGAFIVGASYAMLAAVAYFSKAGASASWLWLVAYFFVYTVGELLILPVGLGLFGRLAPPAFAATMIAAWFLASFAGNFAAGALGVLWGPLSPAAFFAATAIVSAVAGALLLSIAPWAQATVSRAEQP